MQFRKKRPFVRAIVILDGTCSRKRNSWNITGKERGVSKSLLSSRMRNRPRLSWPSSLKPSSSYAIAFAPQKDRKNETPTAAAAAAAASAADRRQSFRFRKRAETSFKTFVYRFSRFIL